MSDESAFDIIILGTGLVESIAAAALSKAGLKVAHLDENAYYGGAQASLSLDEFVDYVNKLPGSSVSPTTLPHSRAYSITLAPSIIPAVGPLISSLVSSGVARYGGFRLIDRVSIYDKALGIVSVPASKEDIFKSKSIPLVDKRRLMRFLMFAAGDFEQLPEMEGTQETPFGQFLTDKFNLKDDVAKAITYALAFSDSPAEPTLPVVQRLHRYLRSAGRYGASPFLVGHYGSAGEIAQGFCRTAAVAGGVYILGRRVTSISSPTTPDGRYTITLADFPEPITCSTLVCASSTNSAQVHCVAIVDQPISFGDESGAPEASILVFPPGEVEGGVLNSAVTAFVVGESTMSTPQGRWIIYLSANCENNSGDVLKPYLDALLKVVQPLFTAFYAQKGEMVPVPEGAVVSTGLGPLLFPELSDRAAEAGEKLFADVMRRIGKGDEIYEMWPPLEQNDVDDED
ncbi:FAD/NAD(P)-binding domain-containing protein [Cylindrobasidium torrendii FP15055 ss-10]|uniref:FAD/NAD(P)-binding domain-containing protein n=1 Tax=Cylindrobasidium torrendii FP15055 ss-10 TaxID=1314674 RepID=A0A0D7BJD4_9AGAR|nr:FAD/NAD(P)-binding domain-containing protein [Cylindrobasidium torrendii FP15055 ss-10]